MGNFKSFGTIWFSRSALGVTMRHQNALFWGGSRGALALALALGLPAEVPMREEILTITFAVVAFSIFVQGLTMKPLLRRLRQRFPTNASHAERTPNRTSLFTRAAQ